MVHTRRTSYIIQSVISNDADDDVQNDEDLGTIPDDDDKDTIISNQQTLIKELKGQVKSLTEALFREQEITDSFLELRRVYKQSAPNSIEVNPPKEDKVEEDELNDSLREQFPPNQTARKSFTQSSQTNVSASPFAWAGEATGDNESSRHSESVVDDDEYQRVEKRKQDRTAEDTRIHRCKGALYSLKRYMPKSVKTVFLADSNHRSIYEEQLDGVGNTVKSLAVGGLCIPAAIKAMEQSSDLSFNHVETFVIALGTNDFLHAKTHSDIDHMQNMKELNLHARRMFPRANIKYIPPFEYIRGMGKDNVKVLTDAVKESEVGWSIIPSPGMRGKLAAPEYIHLKKNCRKFYAQWLQKAFKLLPRDPSSTSHKDSVERSMSTTTPPKPVSSPTYGPVNRRPTAEKHSEPPSACARNPDPDIHDGPWVKTTPNTDSTWLGPDPKDRFWNYLMSRVQHPTHPQMYRSQPAPPWPYIY